ncbi:MAG: AsnC family transcriptional regulator [Haloarculaceae archaeon]
MRGLDDTDREILRLLLDDARRPYSEIADAVDLSPPAVSDRIERLQDIGLVRRFTVDIDRSMLEEGVPILVTVDTRPGTAQNVRDGLATSDSVEYVFRTVDDRVVFTATVPGGEAGQLITDAVELNDVRDYEVRLLADTDWSPRVSDAELAAECVECGNTVTAEGESVTLDGDVYHFCCENCRASFVEEYERLSDEV